MQELIYIILTTLGLLVGVSLGYKFGYKKGKNDRNAEELFSNLSTINNLSIQIAELKAKYEEIEKARLEAEKQREKLNEEKEKRFKDFIENTQRLFSEISN